MKYLIVMLVFAVCSNAAFAQGKEDTIPVYKRYPTLPGFTIMTVPDSLPFNKDDMKKRQPVLLVIFSPDCDHCKHFTNELLEKYDLLKKVQIVMVSSLDFQHIRKFYEEHHIASYSRIVMGRDAGYMFGTFFSVRSYPTAVLYDKKGKLLEKFEGNISIEKVADAL